MEVLAYSEFNESTFFHVPNIVWPLREDVLATRAFSGRPLQ